MLILPSQEVLYKLHLKVIGLIVQGGQRVPVAQFRKFANALRKLTICTANSKCVGKLRKLLKCAEHIRNVYCETPVWRPLLNLALPYLEIT